MEIETWIAAQEQEFLDDIAALIRIRSVAGSGTGDSPYGKECRLALDTMLGLGRKYGFEVLDCDGYAGEICWENLAVSEQKTCKRKQDAIETKIRLQGTPVTSKENADGIQEIGIWGHLDVVPEGDGWQYPPYEMTREGDFLIGRGVQDNKGPLVAVLYAMRFLKESGWKPGKRYRLIFGCNEECGMDDVEYVLAHRSTPDYSFVADCGFPVCRGEKGILHLEIEKRLEPGSICRLESGSAVNIVPGEAQAELLIDGTRRLEHASGIPGHAAFPEGTVHAAGKLCSILLKQPIGDDERNWITFLEKLCSDGWGTGLGIACADGESGRLTCNPGRISWQDGVCRVSFDIRYPVTVCAQQLLDAVDKTAWEYGFVWKVCRLEEPFCVPEDHPLVQKLMEVYDRSMEGEEPEQPYIMGGGTYAKKIPHTVGFGPGLDQHLERLGFSGSRGSCHSMDEAQSLTNLKMAMKIYANAIQALDGL